MNPRRIAPVEDDRVPVEIPADAHAADAGVVDADELAAAGHELVAGGMDVGDAQCQPGHVRPKLLAVALRVPEAERHVRRLDLALGVLALPEPEDVTVESDRARDVA